MNTQNFKCNILLKLFFYKVEPKRSLSLTHSLIIHETGLSSQILYFYKIAGSGKGVDSLNSYSVFKVYTMLNSLNGLQ